MKSSMACLLTIILGAIQADAECVEGHRETISPGYTVEHKCDLYQPGTRHDGIDSERDCAALCEPAGVSVCSYHPPTKICIVGNESSADVPRSGVTYMKKAVESPAGGEDPFETDPFEEDCGQAKDDCLKRESSLKSDLTRCQTGAAAASDAATLKDVLAANCPSQHVKESTVSGRVYKFWCARYHDPSGQKEKHNNVDTFATCVKLCSQRSWCTYVLHGIFQTTCQLYDRKVAYTLMPGQSDHFWNCAVKK